MVAPVSSAKPLPTPPNPSLKQQQQQQQLTISTSIATTTTPLMLDDDAKVHLWKLIHTWLRHEQLQVKWASVLNDIIMDIFDSISNISVETDNPICIQLFETGSPNHSKYLSSVTYGDQLQILSGNKIIISIVTIVTILITTIEY